MRAALCMSAFEREALPAAARPTCCSGSRATVRTGTGGWRYLIQHAVPTAARCARNLAARRRRLTPAQRAHAARQVARNVERALQLKAGWRIALYAALPWELDTTPLIELARARGCRIYLPRIDRPRAARGMRFLEMTGALRSNRLGIEEPDNAARIGARWLDVVFLPLVGFDRYGAAPGHRRGLLRPRLRLPALARQLARTAADRPGLRLPAARAHRARRPRRAHGRGHYR